jgi:hypothetical protein
MHELGDKRYEATFLRLDSGIYNTAEANVVLALNDATDLMRKQGIHEMHASERDKARKEIQRTSSCSLKGTIRRWTDSRASTRAT